MFMNFLDYAACRFMFSAGQVDRMHATLDGERAAIQASDALIPPAGVPGSDLYIQDTPDDVGNQPNNESAVLYVSEDIWVRTSDDGMATQSHQNPVYKTTGSNYVYVRVRNRSCNTAAPAATVRLYWANASTGLSWPDPWTGGVTTPALMGSPISPVGVQSTGVIAAGASQVLRFEWTVPNPIDYAVFGEGMRHFCLLARLEEPGVTLTETDNLWNNVKNNNNIAWKNIAVDNNISGGDAGADFLVGNYAQADRTVNLRIQTRFEDRATAAKLSQPIIIDLGERLFSSWYARNKDRIDGGAYRDQFTIVNRKLLLKTGNADLKNFLFAPRELQAIKVKLNSRQYVFSREQSITVDVQQVDAKTGGIIGGERVKFTMLPWRT